LIRRARAIAAARYEVFFRRLVLWSVERFETGEFLGKIVVEP
jgi:hypothetical protein